MRFVTKDFSHSALLLWLRFVDDVFGAMYGTKRNFNQVLTLLNAHLEQYGVRFTVDWDNNPPGNVVNFLDVTVDKSGSDISTYLYQKPTDARRYLHRASFHAAHTLKGVVLSQMRGYQ